MEESKQKEADIVKCLHRKTIRGCYVSHINQLVIDSHGTKGKHIKSIPYLSVTSRDFLYYYRLFTQKNIYIIIDYIIYSI